MLAEGQCEEGIELTKIDEAAGSVVLRYMGDVKTIAFVPQAFSHNR